MPPYALKNKLILDSSRPHRVTAVLEGSSEAVQLGCVVLHTGVHPLEVRSVRAD